MSRLPALGPARTEVPAQRPAQRSLTRQVIVCIVVKTASNALFLFLHHYRHKLVYDMAFPSTTTASLPDPAPFTTPPQPREQHLGYNMNRIWNVQPSSQSSSGDSASLSSRGSTQQDGIGSSTTASQHTASSSRTSVGSNFESLPAGAGFLSYAFEGNTPSSYCYYLDRGSGQFTRLIPADMLPPMKGLPGREEEHDGMVILQPLENLQLQNAKEDHRVSTPKVSS